MFEKVSTEDSVLYTGMRSYLLRGRKLWVKPFLFTPVVFAIAIAISASGLLSGIRPFFLLYLIVAIVLSLNLKNAFIGFFLTFLFTLQFVHPNKGYSIEVIRGSEILEPAYFEGYSIGYFFHLPSFFFLLSGGAMIREMFTNRGKIPRQLGLTLIGISTVWLIFTLIGMYGISRYSPFVFLSNVWLFQYGMMYYVAIGVCFGLAMFKQFRSLLFSTLAVILGTQLFVSIFQLVAQRSAGFRFEAEAVGSFATGLDENNAVFRVMGTFMFPNQLSFITALLSAAVLPYGLERKSLFHVGAGLLGLFIVLLTQTRSILIGIAIMCIVCAIAYRRNLQEILQKFGTRRMLFYIMAAFVLSAFGIIPRIILSANAGYPGAGLAIRVRMVNEAVEAIAGSPLIGYGVATNEYVLYQLFPNGVMTVFPAVVHLGYLQLWMEVGVLGVIVFLLPMLWLFRYSAVTSATKGLPSYYRYAFMNGLVIALIFWLLLPHIGIIEFPFLGIVLGLGSFWYYLSTSKKKAL